MAKIAVCGYWRYSNVVRQLATIHDIAYLIVSEKEPTEHLPLDELGNPALIKGPFSQLALKTLAKDGVTRLYVGGYPYKIPAIWSDHFEFAVNLHPSLLPEGRGPAIEPHVILRGLSTNGVTLHKISEKWDQGDIILQKKYDVSVQDTAHSLIFKNRLAAFDLIQTFEANPQKLWQAAKPQTAEGSYWQRPNAKDSTIDWHWPVEKIDRYVRAFANMGALCLINGHEVRIAKITYWKEAHQLPVGNIIDFYMGGEMLIPAQDGFVVVESYYTPENET